MSQINFNKLLDESAEAVRIKQQPATFNDFIQQQCYVIDQNILSALRSKECPGYLRADRNQEDYSKFSKYIHNVKAIMHGKCIIVTSIFDEYWPEHILKLKLVKQEINNILPDCNNYQLITLYDQFTSNPNRHVISIMIIKPNIRYARLDDLYIRDLYIRYTDYKHVPSFLYKNAKKIEHKMNGIPCNAPEVLMSVAVIMTLLGVLMMTIKIVPEKMDKPKKPDKVEIVDNQMVTPKKPVKQQLQKNTVKIDKPLPKPINKPVIPIKPKVTEIALHDRSNYPVKLREINQTTYAKEGSAFKIKAILNGQVIETTSLLYRECYNNKTDAKTLKFFYNNKEVESNEVLSIKK